MGYRKSKRGKKRRRISMEDVDHHHHRNAFHPDLIHAIFKLVWTKRALERDRSEANDAMDCEGGAGTSKKNRPMSANSNALKLSSELLRIFVSETVQRAASIAEAEGLTKIEATHLERVLPQLLLDF